MLKLSVFDFVGNWVVLGVLVIVGCVWFPFVTVPLIYFVLNLNIVRTDMEPEAYREWRKTAEKATTIQQPWHEPPRF